MKTFKLFYSFWNYPDKENEMIVKADDIIEAMQIGAKRIKAKYRGTLAFSWNTFKVLD